MNVTESCCRGWLGNTPQMPGAQVPGTAACSRQAAVTGDTAQRRGWGFFAPPSSMKVVGQMTRKIAGIVVSVLLAAGTMSTTALAAGPDTAGDSLVRRWFSEDSRFALAYGPFRTWQSPGGPLPSFAEIEEDLGIIKQETGRIRLYGSCGFMATIPALAAKHGLEVIQGVALSAKKDENEREMRCFGDRLAQSPNIIAGLVGNEILLRQELTEEELAGYIDRARGLGAKVPLSTGETWNSWCSEVNDGLRCPGRKRLGESVDFIAAHFFPYWEGVPVEHGAAHVLATWITLRAAFPAKEVIVTETGWPTGGRPFGLAEGNVENQRRFLRDLRGWAKDYRVPVVLFEIFDEPWKEIAEGQVGGHWGSFDVKRKAKHPGLKWPAAAAAKEPDGPAVRIEHPRTEKKFRTKTNCGIPVFGRAWHAGPGWHVRLEVHSDNWYPQEQWYPAGLIPVIDGMWSVPEAVLGGLGASNRHVLRATLLDADGKAVATDEIDGLVRTNECTP